MKRFIFLAVVVLLSVQAFGTDQSVGFNCSSGGYLDIADSSQTGLDITGSFTVEMWIKFTANDMTQGKYIFCKYGAVGNRSFYWHLNPNGSAMCPGVVCYMDQSGNDTYIQDNTSLLASSSEVNTWIHIAASVDVPNHAVKFYKNGLIFGSPSVARANVSSIMNSTAPFIIGSSYSIATPCGPLKDYRIWNVIRSEQDIYANYSHELNGIESGLVAYWKFDGNANDETSNHNNLTPHGTVSYSSDAPSLSAPLPIISHKPFHFAPVIGDNSNGLPKLAALQVNDSMVPTVTILDASNGQELEQINFFNADWAPKKVLVYDVNNDSLPEISVLASKADSTRVESRSLNGTLVNSVPLP